MVGLTLQVVALHNGAIAVVQPLLTSGLLFALILRAVHHRRLHRGELAWAALLSCFLAGFLVVAGAAPGASANEGVDRLPAILAR